MALSQTKTLFGIHSLTLFDPDTEEVKAYLKALSEASFQINPEWVDLETGSYLYPVDTEIGKMNSEFKVTAQELNLGAMELLLGGDLTTNAAEATGSVSTITNKSGTSVVNASTGINAVAVTSGDHADLKTGFYTVKATAAKVCKLYCFSDVDFHRTGTTDVDFTDDTLEVASLDFTSGDVIVASLGLTFDAGSGTIAFTAGDTATFYVRKPNTKSYELSFGQSGAQFPELGCILQGQYQGSGILNALKLYRVRLAGFPINFSRQKFSEWSLTGKVLFDSVSGLVGKLFRIEP